MEIDKLIKELFIKTKNEEINWTSGEGEFTRTITEYNLFEGFDSILEAIYYSIQKNYNLVISTESADEHINICLYVLNKKNKVLLAYDDESVDDGNTLEMLYDVIIGEYNNESEIIESILEDL